MKLDRSQRTTLESICRAWGVESSKIEACTAALEGRGRIARESQLPIAVSQAEAARLLSVSRWSVRRLVAAGTLRPVRIGGLHRFSRSAVEALVTGGRAA